MEPWGAFDVFNDTFGSLGTLAPFVRKYNFQNVASCTLIFCFNQTAVLFGCPYKRLLIISKKKTLTLWSMKKCKYLVG